MDVVFFVHGRGGSPEEGDRYRTLFPDSLVIGVPYTEDRPDRTGLQIRQFIGDHSSHQDRAILIANSIGAFFCLYAELDNLVTHAFFISPVLDMEQLILSMLHASGHTEKELRDRGEIRAASGEILSWDYLEFVRSGKPDWNVRTDILYGSEDTLVSFDTVKAFADLHHAGLCVMESGEHWFHTERQMRFLEEWIQREMSRKPEDFTIRPEHPGDYRTVEDLIRESFWNVYRPGCLEHYVMHVLRSDPAFVKELDFVMEKDGKIIGQNMFMRTVIRRPDGTEYPVLTMGPICIAPEWKHRGYGKILLDYSLDRASRMGYGAVLFEGNIRFYGKSGFDYARRFGILYHDMPEDADQSFFLCRELKSGYLDGVTGIYETPPGYYVSEEEADSFDRSFPPKVRRRLPGQLS